MLPQFEPLDLSSRGFRQGFDDFDPARIFERRQHGFDVPDMGIKEPVRSGQTAIITIKSPPKGEYKVVCGIICGPHHDDMVAKLVVE
jgi:hypothetical protein